MDFQTPRKMSKFHLLRNKNVWINLDHVLSIKFFQKESEEITSTLSFAREENDEALTADETSSLIAELGISKRDVVDGIRLKEQEARASAKKRGPARVIR